MLGLERNECLMAMICSELPEELVSMVAERVACLDDLIRFGAVCKLWRSVSISQKQEKKAYAPLLMLANAENDILPSDGEGTRSFVIPYYRDGNGNKKMMSFDIELPKAQGRRCWGSPYGWIVIVGLDFNISLLNPLTGAHLPLPSQKILHQCLKSIGFSYTPRLEPDATISIFIRKFALGGHQSSQSWLVVAIFGGGEEVGFTFTGIENQNEAFSSSSTWTGIKYSFKAKDVILFQGRIFIIASSGGLRVYDIEEGTPSKEVHILPPPKQLDNSDTFYLVEIGGNLHFVARYFDTFVRRAEIGYGTSDFEFGGLTSPIQCGINWMTWERMRCFWETILLMQYQPSPTLISQRIASTSLMTAMLNTRVAATWEFMTTKKKQLSHLTLLTWVQFLSSLAQLSLCRHSNVMLVFHVTLLFLSNFRATFVIMFLSL